MTKVQEMQMELTELQTKAQAALNAKNVAEAEELMNKVRALKSAIAMQQELDEAAKASVQKKAPQTKEKNLLRDFGDAVRSGFRNATMTIASDPDGGYLVPEDIQTMIQKRREAKASLLDFVKVTPVKTDKGRRTFKKRTQMTGFTLVDEAGKIGQIETPQFEPVIFDIKKYAGWLPVSNELLDDGEGVANAVIEWFGDEDRVTANKNIIAAVQTKEAVAFAGLDDIKKALNVTLGAAFKPYSKIITNDDGLQYLDTLKDGNDRYILQPDPTSPADLRLQTGATTVPIVVIPNSDMPTTGGKIPVIVGDLKEGIEFFDRKKRAIKASDVATAGALSAFENDLTLYRGITRHDVQVRDSDAFVNGYITAE